MSFDQRNRRRHPRADVDGSVLLDSTHSAVNLSEMGMKMTSATHYNEGKLLTLKLGLDEHTLILRAKVVWCKEAASVYNDKYTVGVEFVDHTIGEQLIIREYVSSKQ